MRRREAGGIAAVLIMVSAAGCDPALRIRGTVLEGAGSVTDLHAQPVSDVHVQLESGRQILRITTTDVQGRYSVFRMGQRIRESAVRAAAPSTSR